MSVIGLAAGTRRASVSAARASSRLPITGGNLFLSALSPSVRHAVESIAERVRLRAGAMVYAEGDSISHVYLIETGMIVEAKYTEDGDCVEIASAGPEGIGPVSALLQSDTTVLESVAAMPTTALRIPRAGMSELVRSTPEVERLVESCSGLALEHIARTAACNIRHSIEERCCRWLLTAHGNARHEYFPLTHEFLALMLGVRRAGVSCVAQHLQRRGAISYARGVVRVIDRKKLYESACECYASMRDRVDALFSRHMRSWL